MKFFLKLVGLPQNRSESFGIGPNLLIVFLRSLVALALPERPQETWFHFRIKKLIPEYPRMWNQMIRFLRHFDRSFQSVKVVTHTD